MKKKMILLSLLTLGICSMAQAMEYKNPDVGFKKHAAPSKEMKVADFGEHYKVETGTGMDNDRQIASEEADRERDPSSFAAQKKKKEHAEEEKVEDPKDAPKPWLYRTQEGSRN